MVVVLLALVYAELGAAYPLAGGTLRYPHFAFGSTAGFTAGWLAWIGSVTLAPIEVEVALLAGRSLSASSPRPRR